eukprot:INCI19252.1.p1 GENE.INCI19252.1~~INCI19252.1.p1  ORF type:complete len:825 (+),score=207.15 INCI19252.1:175-2649(+)
MSFGYDNAFEEKNGGDDDDDYDFSYNNEIGGPIPGTSSGQPAAFSSAGQQRMTTASGGIIGRPTTTSDGRTLDANGNVSDRPMTSIQNAGYKKKSGDGTGLDDFAEEHGTRGPAPPLKEITDNGPEPKAKELEKQVNTLLEESAAAKVSDPPDFALAVEKAKQAGKKEAFLNKHREKHNLGDHINMDLTYAVCFNLADAYHKHGQIKEALSAYNVLVKNKQYPQSGRLRINMGNIYFEQQQYPTAIKMYKMALDQIRDTGKRLRCKVLRNIGIAQLRLREFGAAAESFENIIKDDPADHQAAYNLVITYFALGRPDLMKRSFSHLISIPIESPVDDDADSDDDDEVLLDKPDPLKVELEEREKRAKDFILNAAKLIAPALDKDNWEEGYEWVIDSLAEDHDKVSSEVAILKATTYLKKGNFDAAIKALKAFEKKDRHLKAKAATNLSFVYYLEGDVAQADEYANMAVRYHRYNAKALVNKGNCYFVQGQYERAKELYLEAIGVEADCTESIFNLGLVNKRLGYLSDALQAFEKLHSIVPNLPEVIYQIANVHDMLDDHKASTDNFHTLLTQVPSDPGVHAKLGRVYNKRDDQTNAFHYHRESYRFFPVDLDVISWLGVWYVKQEFYEQAITFFERAAEIQPNEVKWKLMIASCYRRMANFQHAVDLYEEIHRLYPENQECLRYLIIISKELNIKYDHYQREFAKLERINTESDFSHGGGAMTQMQHGGGGGMGGMSQGGGGGSYPDAPKHQQGGASQARFSAFSQPDNAVARSPEPEPEESPTQRARAAKAAAKAPAPAPAPKSSAGDDDSEDEWGSADMDDLL